MQKYYDCIIIGGGPAGLSAAIYTARANCRTLVIERNNIGGQTAITSDVANYPGIPHVDGTVLTKTMQQQAQQFGAEFLFASVTKIQPGNLFQQVHTDKGMFLSLGLILATGASPRMAGFQGEAEFRGRGVSYCATCDGAFFQGKSVFVIGGGHSAAQEALFLSKFASHVTMCIRRDRFSCPPSMANRVLTCSNIQVRFQTELIEAGGDTLLRYVILRDKATGTEIRHTAPKGTSLGIFVFAGYTPETALFPPEITLTQNDYLQTDKQQRTNLPGIYGAGDVCEKPLRQIVTAVSDGAVAATTAEHDLVKLRERYHLPIFFQIQPGQPKVHSVQSDTVRPEKSKYFHSTLDKQLRRIFSRLRHDLWIHIHYSSASSLRFVRTVCDMSPHLHWRIVSSAPSHTIQPTVLEFCSADGTSMRVFFHGIPNGHELQAFATTIYNAAGAGTPLDEVTKDVIQTMTHCQLAVAVMRSCTMCPDTVIAACRMALLCPEIRTDIYDLKYHPQLQKRHQIMSVPCILLNDNIIGFGKKSIQELIELIQKATAQTNTSSNAY